MYTGRGFRTPQKGGIINRVGRGGMCGDGPRSDSGAERTHCVVGVARTTKDTLGGSVVRCTDSSTGLMYSFDEEIVAKL